MFCGSTHEPVRSEMKSFHEIASHQTLRQDRWPTNICLEDAFWSSLKRIAHAERATVTCEWVSGICWRDTNSQPLEATGQRQNQHYDQNDAENAGRAVAPTGAMTPGRNCANQEQDQYNDENSTEHSCAPYHCGRMRPLHSSGNNDLPISWFLW